MHGKLVFRVDCGRFAAGDRVAGERREGKKKKRKKRRERKRRKRRRRRKVVSEIIQGVWAGGFPEKHAHLSFSNASEALDTSSRMNTSWERGKKKRFQR